MRSRKRRRHVTASRTRSHRDAFLKPQAERLEQRCMLDGGLSEAVSPNWFAEVAISYQAEPPQMIAAASPNFVGPMPLDVRPVSRWIVHLTPKATAESADVEGATSRLQHSGVSLRTLRGLGAPGLLLVEGKGAEDAIASVLTQHPDIDYFEQDQRVSAQRDPNDSDFQSGLQTGLHNTGQFGGTTDADVDAPEAWDLTTGSPSVVVGVLDSGVDPTHPDLFLNIWINQGEIRETLKSQLTQVDSDDVITFYDLNNCMLAPTVSCDWTSGPNASLLTDFNANGFIDAHDLLEDPRWADGLDTDHNGFIDDFFGWNFRSGPDEPFAPNNPTDVLGHGTHVSGTIAAVGNNGVGVAGVNWQSSIMALKFLDNNNQGNTSDAIAAINYATMMRQRDEGSVNVRALNNSWGQPGGFSANLENAIRNSRDAGILFVAAAGNGNILGRGVDNDRTPFYPASYELDNIIAVAASDSNDGLGRFSNFGSASVDIAAPGVGVRSTLPGGGYGIANGTSMATPHVTGTAALIWSLLPEASVAEAKQAILDGADSNSGLSASLVTSGRLNAYAAVDSDVFAPRAALLNDADVSVAGGTENLIIVRFQDRQGIDDATLGDGDIVATRQWGPRDAIPLTLVAGSVTIADGGNEVTATYRLGAPGGSWDALDYGRYVLSAGDGQVANLNGQSVPAEAFGEFTVRIADDAIFYVNSLADVVDVNVGDEVCADASGNCTLRAAIQEANAATGSSGFESRTIILEAGEYPITIPHVTDPSSTFPFYDYRTGCTSVPSATGWSSDATGDFDAIGDITIVGDSASTTKLDAQNLDRVFRVHPSGSLSLKNLTVTGGGSATDQGGAGILSAGELALDHVEVSQNFAAGGVEGVGGGGIAVWAGSANLVDSTLAYNTAFAGGGLFACNDATVNISRSTLNNNQASRGGGVASVGGGEIVITNSTLSTNSGGAIESSRGWNLRGDYKESEVTSISSDGNIVAFMSNAANLVVGDNNPTKDAFVFDRTTGITERVSVDSNGIGGNGETYNPALSADGRFVSFTSAANNLIVNDSNDAVAQFDIFVRDRMNQTTERVSVGSDRAQGNGSSYSSSISADGRFVVFASDASNFSASDTNGVTDIYVFDRQTDTIELVSAFSPTSPADGASYAPSISADGRYIAFESDASNLVSGDTNGTRDIFALDRGLPGSNTHVVTRVSVDASGFQGFGFSTGAKISADGSTVAFSSNSNTLVANDTNGQYDVFAKSLVDGSVALVSVSTSGALGDQSSSYPSISSDGRFVSFGSPATNLVTGDTNGVADIFVRDLVAQTTTLVSVGEGGTLGNADSYLSYISGAGDVVALTSNATSFLSNPFDSLTISRNAFVGELATPGLLSVNVPWLSAPTTLSHVTAAYNNGTATAAGSIMFSNSLFAGNTGFYDAGDGTQSLGNNVLALSKTPLLSSDVLDPLAWQTLTVLQDIDGATRGHLPLQGNAAIDLANTTTFSPVDQRGVPREHQVGTGKFPDSGAVETVTAAVSGVVYWDLNRNSFHDANEPGLDEIEVLDELQPTGSTESVTTLADDPITTSIVESGRYIFPFVTPGSHRLTAVPPKNWQVTAAAVERVTALASGPDNDTYDASVSQTGRFVAFGSSATNLATGNTAAGIYVLDRETRFIDRVSVNDSGTSGNNLHGSPSISGDGQFVAFVGASSNLVAGDSNGQNDIFVFDRNARTIERVSVATGGTQANGASSQPSISQDGRYVTFASTASNLVASDTNGLSDIFVHDRVADQTTRVNVGPGDVQSNGFSETPTISADGRYVAYTSYASNLLAGDTNLVGDVFVFDRQLQTTERVSVSSSGDESDSNVLAPVISGDGRYVAFTTAAKTLVAGQAQSIRDAFVHDRDLGTTKIISASLNGGEGSDYSIASSISDDGRYVLFYSAADNLVADDTNGQVDAFVYDQVADTLAIVSLNDGGNQATSFSFDPIISGDGRSIAFESMANNFVAGDDGIYQDIYIAPNRLAASDLLLDLQLGQWRTNVNLGLVPLSGELQGRLFVDEIVNQTYDLGEQTLAGVTVYLDANKNSILDATEVRTTTDAQGNYRFAELGSVREYRIGVEAPVGFEVAVAGGYGDRWWNVFLPAGESIGGRDFGFRRSATLGQFENSSARGQVFVDSDGDGKRQASEAGRVGVVVFADFDQDGIRDHDEPRTVTVGDNSSTESVDESGSFTLTGLGNREYTLRVLLPENTAQSTPVGNQFDRVEVQLAQPGQPFSNPQDIVSGDFNLDGLADLAVAMAERNTVALLMNDGDGGFGSLIDVPVEGRGPVGLLVGQFNGQGSVDLAVANTFSNEVTIFFDYGVDGFGDSQVLPVGRLPRAITSADLNDDGDVDLIVANELDGTLSILRNDGSGNFSAEAGPTVGNSPFGLVAVQLTDDNNDQVIDDDDTIDLAVANFGTHPFGADLGDVSILLGDGSGGFGNAMAFDAGSGPTSVAAADFNHDGYPDLAVANFLSDTISILLNQQDGSFLSAATLSAGAGPTDIEVRDMEGDGDVDLIVMNRSSQDVSIIRNAFSLRGAFGFEPAQSFGRGDFPVGIQLTLTVDDFNEDGAADIALANGHNDTLTVMTNRSVAGAHRVALDGTNVVSGLDFGIVPLNITPTLAAIANPIAISEDPDPREQSVALTGITAGGTDTQELRVTAVSSNTGLVANPIAIDFVPGESVATLRYEPLADQFGTTVITVTVVDAGNDGDLDTAGDNGQVSRSFTVTVNAVNDAPIASDDTASTSEETPLDIAWATLFSNDTDVDSLTTAWTVASVAAVSGGSVANNRAARNVRFTPTTDFEGAALFRYTLSDGAGGTDEATVTVNVAGVNDAPSAIGLDKLSVNENVPAAVIGNIQVIDSDASDMHTWSVSDVRFVVDAGQLKLAAGVSLDTEADSSIPITITVTDSGDEDFVRSFDILVGDINEFAPNVTDDSVSVAENTSVGSEIYTVTSTDQDRTHNHRYSIASGNVGGTFAIDEQSGVLSLLTSPDHESRQAYSLVVTVTDGLLPVKVASATVQVAISDVNEFDPVTADVQKTIPENLIDGSFVVQIPVTDGDTTQQHNFVIKSGDPNGVFEISGAGRITIKDAAGLDFQTTPQFTLTIEVTDPFGAMDTAIAVIVIDRAAVNDPPTLASIADIVLDEDSGNQTISLSGISAGIGETQPLRVTVRSDREDLLETRSIAYLPGESTGTLSFRPAPNASGAAVLTIAVTDGGLDGDLGTPGDNKVFERSLTLTITPVNDPPTLNALPDIRLDEDAPQQAINLSGITAGPGENQPLRVSVTSSNTTLVPTPTIQYQSPQSGGSLRFAPAAGSSGMSVITVEVMDGGVDKDLETTSDNLSVQQSFTVTVDAINDPPRLQMVINEDAAEQTIDLVGIVAGEGESQQLAIAASSSNPSLIADPAVIYSAPAEVGQLRFTPARNAFGTTMITVTVTDAGLDDDMSTADDNGVTTYTLNVTVNPVNDAPLAEAFVGRTNEDTLLTADLPITDVEGLASLSIRLDPTNPIHQELEQSVTFELTAEAVLLHYDPSQVQRLQSLVAGLPEQLVIAYLVDDGESTPVAASATITIDGVNDWHNPTIPLDVNQDGSISPIDALQVINWLNAGNPSSLPGLIGLPEFFLDTDNDNFVAPIDVLLVINHLNGVNAEGEAQPPIVIPPIETTSAAEPTQFPRRQLPTLVQTDSFNATPTASPAANHVSSLATGNIDQAFRELADESWNAESLGDDLLSDLL